MLLPSSDTFDISQDACRRLVEAALTHMSELEFRETILQSLPEDFKPLLGPEPKVQPLETPVEASAEEAMVPEGTDGNIQNGHVVPAAGSAASRFGPQLLQKVKSGLLCWPFPGSDSIPQ